MKLSIFSILTLIFVTLKLMGEITWSWWWVLAPTWMPLVLVVVLLIGAIALAVKLDK